MPQVITPEEMSIVRKGVQKYINGDRFIIDVKDKNITVYLCDQRIDDLMEAVSLTAGKNSAQARASLVQSFTYSPMMQFVLSDPETREFVVERWCFRGSVDDWIQLDFSANLSALVDKYSRHLDRESFFDLIP